MKMYRQRKDTLDSFDFYEQLLSGPKLTVRSGVSGKKIKETVKQWDSPEAASKAYRSNMNKKLKHGFFETEGGANGPLLDNPLNLEEPPVDFKERLTLLEQKGLYLYANHHHIYESKDAAPLETLSFLPQNNESSPFDLVKTGILSSETLIDQLKWYREFEIGDTSEREWTESLIEELAYEYSGWKILDETQRNLGAYRALGSANFIEIGISASALFEERISDWGIIPLEAPSENSSGTKGAVDEISYMDEVETSELGKICMHSSAKLRAEVCRWLFKDFSVSAFELTTSTNFMVIGRPFALKFYVLENLASGAVYAQFHHMQVDY